MLGCKQNYTPKPRGYHRLDLPQKEYAVYDSACPFVFEYPIYGQLKESDPYKGRYCWFNLSFPKQNAKIHLTYKEIQTHDDLIRYTEDVRKIAYKHTIKANAIEENIYQDTTTQKFGIIYDIKGNAASHVNFFVTDSIAHFLSGSLYFGTTPNYDSLAPAIGFFRKDIVHLIESLHWKR
jgi:gliding motility-associated lipoprotein GldD